MSEKVVRTETVGAQGWDGDIVDILDDLSSVFDVGERVVVIAEAEYEAMKSLNDAVKTVGATGEALITTKTKYYAMERFIDEQGYAMDAWGNVLRTVDK